MESGPEAMRRYRALRDDMTQETLARRSGLSLGAVQAAEQGKDKPKFPTAKKYDDALNAGGDVLLAFGYASNNGQSTTGEAVSRSEFVQLRDDVQGLAQVVDRMERRLREAGLFGDPTPPAGQGRPSA